MKKLNIKLFEKSKLFLYMTGVLAGILNGMFGAGGGMVVVPLLMKYGTEPRKAHATSIAVILPLSIISGIIYLFRGDVEMKDTLIFIPAGIVGAVIGTFLIKKIKNIWLSRIFYTLMIVSAVKLIFPKLFDF